MKTVGIITYHHYCNYGTMLQAYALQHYIESLGYGSEIIDFLIDESKPREEMLKLRIKRLPVYAMNFLKYSTIAASKGKMVGRNKLFEDFYQNFLIVGKKHYNSSQQLTENPPTYDGYVVGSDQTWNPSVTNGPEAFFLTFVDADRKKGCYAPSIGLSCLSEKQKEDYKRKLAGFSYLSCREALGAKILSDLTGRFVDWYIDPTLLLNTDEWMKIASKYSINEPYILTYFLGDVKEHRDFVKKLADRTGYKVISLPFSYIEMKNKRWEKKWVGPAEFLSLMKNASYICTDSFHGTAFSINFNIPFFAFCKTKDSDKLSENSRLYNVLDKFGLSDRLMKNEIVPDVIDIDYEYANEVLFAERKKSAGYLKGMLDSITR